MTTNRLLLIGIALAFSAALVSPNADTKKSPSKKTVSPAVATKTINTATPAVTDIPISATAGIASTSIASVSSASQAVNPILAAIQKRMEGDTSNPGGNETMQRPLPLDEDFTAQIGKMLISLALVISIALGLAWVAKRYFVNKTVFGGGHITYLSSYTLSQKSRLHLVKVGNETFLIGEGANQLSLISKLDMEPEEIEDFLPQNTTENPIRKTARSFKNNLSHWQNKLENQDTQNEVKNSLLILGGLSKRLAKKGKEDA